MPPETELIKQQMGQTRAALTEKLETLENKVLGTVSTTTDTVSQTVQDVGATVRETTENVRATMREAISSVRDAFDVSRQFHQHPWLLLGSSVVAGYAGGLILDNLERGHLPSLPALPRAERLLPQSSEVRQRLESQPPARRRVPGFLKALAETFAPELEKLKAAALGMAMGVVRDKLHQTVPPHMREDFAQMMDRITTKLGGEPYPPGAMFGSSEEDDEANGRHASSPMMGMG
jgi:ElaB/YqjD/DUF883 family membrane-anchored ribosome-binding protein